MPRKNKGYNKGWANLKPAKPGEVRNPHGRPKKDRAIADILRRLLESGDDVSVREKILENVVQMALKKDKWAIEFIADRTEGRALERIQQEIDLDEVVIK